MKLSKSNAFGKQAKCSRYEPGSAAGIRLLVIAARRKPLFLTGGGGGGGLRGFYSGERATSVR